MTSPTPAPPTRHHLVLRLIGNTAERICSALDTIPAYEDGTWYRYGCWGCRFRVSRLWALWGD